MIQPLHIVEKNIIGPNKGGNFNFVKVFLSFPN